MHTLRRTRHVFVTLSLLAGGYVCLDAKDPAMAIELLTTSSGDGGEMCDGSVNCIDSVSDTTPSDGQAITLTGFHFDDLDKTNWRIFFKTTNPNAWSFEGSSLTEDGYQGNGAAYTATVALYGSKSLLAEVTCKPPTNCTEVAIRPQTTRTS